MAKYKNDKANIDGYKFDSKVEAKYYEKLKEDKAKGLILNFELQPHFNLQPKYRFNGKNIRAIEYVADFMVYELNGTETVIDIKGFATAEALLKRKLFQYAYPRKELSWLVWYGGEWINYDENKKGIAKRKKE